MVTVVVLGAVGLVAGAVVLGLLAVSFRAAQAGRAAPGGGLPLVGARHAQFGDATAAARAARAARATSADVTRESGAPESDVPLQLVRPAAPGPDQPRPARAA